MTNKIRYFVWLILLFLPVAAAQARVESFVYPKIKESYCGSSISVYYCKCAFHGQNCDAVNTDERGANAKVAAGFQEYVGRQISLFAMRCIQDGGIYSVMKTQCEYCEGNKVRSDGACVDPKDKRPLEEIYRLPKVETQGGTSTLGFVVDGEGEFFVYSPGRGKWIGPVREGLRLFEGDVLHTTEGGRARIRLGTANIIVLERTTMTLPSPKRERGMLERGALFIWENVKRLATNTPLEIEGGAHSVLGIRGTKLLMEVDSDVAKYTLNEGVVDVWNKENPSSKTELKPGESARVTVSGVERDLYEWDAVIKKYDLDAQDLSEPVEPKSFATIDPDAVYPPEAAYSGDLVGKAAERGKVPSSGSFGWIFVLALATGAVFSIKKYPTVFKSENLWKKKYLADAREFVNNFVRRWKK